MRGATLGSLSNLEYLASEPSPLGLVCLRQRAPRSAPGTLVTEITLDHQFLMNNLNTASERALSSVALEMHAGEGLRVLVGGLGLGHTAQAVLASPRVAALETVELLEPVIRWYRDGLLPLAAELAADPRLAVTHGDVYARLASRDAELWDLVLVDVDHSPDEPLGGESEAFYGEAGLALARTHLAPGGVLGVWSHAESPRFAAALARVFGEVRVEPVSFHNPLFDQTETNWLFFARG